MANTFKFGNKKWAVKKDYVLAYNDENNNFKPLPFDFTRDSTATYVDSDGLIKTAGDGIARIDYLDNTDGHLLLEPSRTNEVTNSEDFSQWSITGATVTTNTTTSPDGTQNADEIDFSSDNDRVSTNGGSFTSGDTYTGSVYLKGSGTISLNIGTSSGGGLENEESITLTNEWVRHDVTYTAPSTTGNWRLMIIKRSADTATSAYVWGGQLEEGSYATSYIPTSGASVTRAVENADENVLTNFSGNSYTVLFDMDFSDADSDSNTILGVIWHEDEASSFSFRNWSGDLRIYNNKDSFYPTSAVSSSSNKWVMRVDGTSYKLFGKGSTALTATLSTSRTIYKIDTKGNSANKIKNWKIYNEALSDAECEALID